MLRLVVKKESRMVSAKGWGSWALARCCLMCTDRGLVLQDELHKSVA